MIFIGIFPCLYYGIAMRGSGKKALRREKIISIRDAAYLIFINPSQTNLNLKISEPEINCPSGKWIIPI
ncbi:hypothetical protein [uncultured Nitrosomonas sp.]|uniref:hypothetical protein n=1 Tax=uncultured Nitrosomonas sp. TaxID=156424 RepID=UPI0025DD4343|nr:hypothetical protein [uncultured Nitrosomonas sp.]